MRRAGGNQMPLRGPRLASFDAGTSRGDVGRLENFVTKDTQRVRYLARLAIHASVAVDSACFLIDRPRKNAL
jgi:hypothetical protein